MAELVRRVDDSDECVGRARWSSAEVEGLGEGKARSEGAQKTFAKENCVYLEQRFGFVEEGRGYEKGIGAAGYEVSSGASVGCWGDIMMTYNYLALLQNSSACYVVL